MLIAIVDFIVAPEHREEALAAILAEAPAVRAMTGNIDFQSYLSQEDAKAIRIFHEWNDASDFEFYTSSDTFKALGGVLRPMMIAPPISRRMTAELLETVR